MGWRLTMECGFHNHIVMETLLSHSYVDCLRSEEKTMVSQLTKNIVKPDKILLTIKYQDQMKLNTIKTIYNAC